MFGAIRTFTGRSELYLPAAEPVPTCPLCGRDVLSGETHVVGCRYELPWYERDDERDDRRGCDDCGDGDACPACKAEHRVDNS
jgi:hypothetical protein